MAIKVRLQQSKFKEANRSGRWYARTVSSGDVSTSDLAMEIQNETTFTRGEVEGFITELIDVIARNLRDGKTVVVDGLGRFHLTVESDPVANPNDFDLEKNITDVKLRFVPAGKRDEITKRKVDDFGNGVKIEWYDTKFEDDSPVLKSDYRPVVDLSKIKRQ